MAGGGGGAWAEIAIKAAEHIAKVGAASQALSIAKSQQKQARQIANQYEALAQRAAIERLRESRIYASNALALAAAGGGGVDDPTVLKILNEIEAKGEYSALAALYDGTVGANQMRYEARLAVKAAKQDFKMSLVSGAAEIGNTAYKNDMFRMNGSAKGTSIAAGSAEGEWASRGGGSGGYTLQGGLK
jgi:hypothetical protein